MHATETDSVSSMMRTTAPIMAGCWQEADGRASGCGAYDTKRALPHQERNTIGMGIHRSTWSSTAVAGLLLPSLVARAQDVAAKTAAAPPHTIADTCRRFWLAAALITKITITGASFLLLAWIIGAVGLGYLLFSVGNVEALAAVRSGYCIGAVLWAVLAIVFIWLLGTVAHPVLWLVLLLAILPWIMFGRARKHA